MDLLLLTIALGLLTGLLLGLTGAGGGILSGPLLVLVLHLPVSKAAPISLMAVVLAAGLGMLIGLRQGSVRYRAALLIAAAGLLASPAGIVLARQLPNTPLLATFALLLAYQGWQGWCRQRPHTQANKPCQLNAATGRFNWNRPCAGAMLAAGLMTGLFSGLLGVGGGFFLVPALRRNTPLPMHAIAATSLMVLTLVSAGGLAVWAAQGEIDWPIALPFVGGTVAGMLVGRSLAPRLPEKTLRRTFASLALAVSAALCIRLISA